MARLEEAPRVGWELGAVELERDFFLYLFLDFNQACGMVISRDAANAHGLAEVHHKLDFVQDSFSSEVMILIRVRSLSGPGP